MIISLRAARAFELISYSNFIFPAVEILQNEAGVAGYTSKIKTRKILQKID